MDIELYNYLTTNIEFQFFTDVPFVSPISQYSQNESFEKLDRFPIIAFGRQFLDQGGA